jgi:hypothetical protein
MNASTYAGGRPIVGTLLPLLWRSPAERTRFGDAAVVVFLLAQYLDGIFTYLGIARFGLAVEANPLIAALMSTVGGGPAIVIAKVVAIGLGMALHLGRVHRAVAFLAAFYFAAAVVPWSIILFG